MCGENRFLGLAYLMPFIIGLLVFTVIPFGASFYLSFTDYSLLAPAKWVGLDNFEKLFTRDRTFNKSLSVTLIYVFSTVPLKLAFALFIAIILNYRLKFINFFRTAYYVLQSLVVQSLLLCCGAMSSPATVWSI